VLRLGGIGLEHVLRATRSRKWTSWWSQGRPQFVWSGAFEKRPEDAVLHMKHGHVLVDGHLEPLWRGSVQQRFRLRAVQIVRRRQRFRAELVLEVIRREGIGDVQR
jgi:hypothetical protein